MRKAIVLVAVGALVFAACGGDSGGKSSGGKDSGGGGAPPVSLAGKVSDHGTKAVSGDTLEIEADDFYFGPTYVEAKAGQTVKVELHNEGSASHTFTIDELGIDETLGPDESVTVDVTIPASGRADFYCRFHKGSGMQGAFFSA